MRDPPPSPSVSLSIEPFLRYAIVQSQLKGYLIPSSISSTAKATAFADDVEFFITEECYFLKIIKAYDIYSQQSGSKLNKEKSSVLFGGNWKEKYNSPLNCKVNREGEKYLGATLAILQAGKIKTGTTF